MKKIILTIKDGQLNSKIKGFNGNSCRNIDKFLYDIGVKSSEVKTKEYYVSNQNKVDSHAMVRK